jgi:hypothetical protein
MAENLTQPTGADVAAFLESVPDARRREDAKRLTELMARVSGQPATMWGTSIVGFGEHHYKYESGREGDTFVVGFAPRKAAMTIYGLYNEYEDVDPLFTELGPHTTGKGCVYVKRLDEVREDVLEQLIRNRVERGNP